MLSPSSTRPMGPPTNASGATWPTQAPQVAPEKRPSVISSTSLPRPAPLMAPGTARISREPGPPLGPSFRLTSTSPLPTRPPVTAAKQSSSESNTLALPRKVRLSLPGIFTTEPAGARLPRSTARPPSAAIGGAPGGVTSPSRPRRRLTQPAHHRGDAPDPGDAGHDVAAPGTHVDDVGHPPADGVEVVHGQLDPGLAGDGQQVKHGVVRPGGGHAQLRRG